jgi:hypothetical protein
MTLRPNGNVSYVTDEIRALIGRTATTPVPALVEPSEVRRFHQALMDGARRYWDQGWAASSRYAGLVAPLAFPVNAMRRQADAPDPLDKMGDADFDGVLRQLRPGLPAVIVPLSNLLNGGCEYEFFRAARHGERVACTSTYRDIYERVGRNGPMVFILIEDFYATETGDPLLRCLLTTILR